MIRLRVEPRRRGLRRAAWLRMVMAVLVVVTMPMALPPSLTQPALAATLGYARAIGGTSDDTGRAIAVDSQRKVYVAGSFQGLADFDPGAGVTSRTSAGLEDGFVSRLDVNGAFVPGVTHIDGVGMDIVRGVAVDSSGNYFISGVTDTTTSPPDLNAFAAKVDANGAIVWTKIFGGAPTVDFSHDVAVDSGGNVYLVGSFFGTADFDPGAGTTNLTSAGTLDGFVLKLNPNGDLLWVKQFGGTDFDEAIGLDVDAAANVYVTGYFRNTVDFDPNGGVLNLTATGVESAFAVKLDTSGNLVWAKAMTGNSSVRGSGIVVGAGGYVHLSGKFDVTTDFDPGASVVNLTSNGGDDAFVLTLDPSGNFVWVKRFGGSGTDLAVGVFVDASSNVYVSGSFQNTVDFDPGTGTANLASAGSDDAFVVKLDYSGDLVWAHRYGGTDSDVGNAVVVDQVGTVYLTGTFTGTADFGAGAGTLVSAGGTDVFVLALTQLAAPVNNVPSAQTMNRNAPLVFSSLTGNQISVSDADNGSTPLQITLSVTNGTLSLSSTVGLYFVSGDGTNDASMTFLSTIPYLNATLNGLSFTPTAGFVGAATLQMTSLETATGLSDSDSVAISITNQVPVAVADNYSVVAQTTLTVAAPGVLVNDTDGDTPAAGLTAHLTNRPASGSVTLNPNGSFVYTPNATFSGVDYFAYAVSDGAVQSTPVTVLITVSPITCVARPAVQVTTQSTGTALQVTVQAVASGNGAPNALTSIRFGQFVNGTVTMNGQAISSGQTVTISPSATTTTFTVRRTTAGQATHIPFTAVDTCGEWPTFVGGGTSAGF